MERYEIIKGLGEGAYGTVYKAKDTKTGDVVALKSIKLEQEEEGIPSTAIREISLLKQLDHKNIIKLYNVVHEDRKLTLVMELLDQDLKKFIDSKGKRKGLDEKTTASFLYQLLNGLDYCHKKQVIHRDLKPQNLLLNSEGALKLADFGLARAFGIPVRGFANEVVTLWYRAPDILMGSTKYSTQVDMWSVGCIFAEMVTGVPLLQGRSEHSQLEVTFRMLGPPTESNFPNHWELPGWRPEYRNIKKVASLTTVLQKMSRNGIDLIRRFLEYNPKGRLSARRALKHKYFGILRGERMPVSNA